jgi:hypothetical protein
MIPAEIIRNRLLTVIVVILVVAALRWSYPVSMPLAVAVFVIGAAWPIKVWLERMLRAAWRRSSARGVPGAYSPWSVQPNQGMAAQADRLKDCDSDSLEGAWAAGGRLEACLGRNELLLAFAQDRVTKLR